MGVLTGGFTLKDKGLRFFLYGMYGRINVGDELVCYAVTKGIQRHFGNPTIFVGSFKENLSKQFVDLKDVQFVRCGCFHYSFWLQFFNILGYVRDVDVIVIGGGGLFQDQYSWRLPAASTFMAAFGVLMDKVNFIVGVGVGPLRRRWLKKTISWVFPYVTHICVRDEQSYETLEELDIPMDNVSVTADVVPSIDLHRKEFGCDVSRDKNLIAVVLRDWPGVDYESVAKLLDELVSKGHRIHLHCFEPLSDSQFYDRILSVCSERTLKATEKIIPKNLQETTKSIKKASLVISMRLHGCILALGLDIPLLPILYERKIRAFMEQMNLDRLLKGVRDLQPELLENIESLRAYWKQHHREIKSQYEDIQKNSVRNFELLREKLDTWRNKKLGWIDTSKVIMGLATLLLFGFVGELIHLISWPFRVVLRK